MSRSYNNTLVLLRVASVLCIALGLMGFVYVDIIFVLVEWMTATSTISSPLYILVGGILLVLSGRFASFVTKHAQPEGDSSSRLIDR